MRPPGILITDPEQRSALAAARSLGRGGFRVVLQGKSRGLAGWSRYASAFEQVPSSALADPTEWVRVTAKSVERHGISVVLPITDAASRALLGNEEQIGAVIAGPHADAYARASDKKELLNAAIACNIRVPRQVVLESPGELDPTALPFRSVVVKPARSVVEVDGRLVGTRVRIVEDGSSLRAVVHGFPAGAYPLLLQERIEGQGVGVFLFRSQRTTLLKFGHRRLREKPPAGGVSTYRQAVTPPDALVAKCEQLLDMLDYNGAAMVEFKEDSTTGDWVLMEINARLWGSVQLAIDSGVDFPLALVQWALGRQVVFSPKPDLNRRSVWELGEVDHILALLRQSRESLQLTKEVPVGFRAAVRVIWDRSIHDRPEVWRWSDPLPFLIELTRWIRRVN